MIYDELSLNEKLIFHRFAQRKKIELEAELRRKQNLVTERIKPLLENAMDEKKKLIDNDEETLS